MCKVAHSIESILKRNLLPLIQMRIPLFSPHQFNHTLCSNSSTLVSQQESTTRFEQIRDIVDISLEIVQEYFEDV